MNRIEADFVVPAAHPSLVGHFPGNPIVPGVLLLDQVLMFLQNRTGRCATSLQQVKFTLALRPDEPVHVLCEVQGSRATFRVTVRRDDLEATVASGSLMLHASHGVAT